ncbi:hypothetical protein Bbelb_293540 [Branchiostoma belcheri]|nr:hypothetical protein Bbelb_293540 [Branchiostoma belcheri]
MRPQQPVAPPQTDLCSSDGAKGKKTVAISQENGCGITRRGSAGSDDGGIPEIWGLAAGSENNGFLVRSDASQQDHGTGWDGSCTHFQTHDVTIRCEGQAVARQA